MRRTQAIHSAAAKALRAVLLAAILISLAAPLLAPGGSPAPTNVPDEQAQWERLIESSLPVSSIFDLPIEKLDVETLRQIIHAPGGVEPQH